MKLYILLVTLLVSVTGINLSAYTFTFKNNLTVPVTVGMQLVARGSHDTKTASAGGEVSFDFGGWLIGFCLESNTVKLTKQGGAEVTVSVAYILSQQAYDTIMNEARANGGKVSREFSNMKNKIGVCRSQVFDIVEDIKGNPAVIMLY